MSRVRLEVREDPFYFCIELHHWTGNIGLYPIPVFTMASHATHVTRRKASKTYRLTTFPTAEKKRIQKARALRQLINKKSRKLFERGLKERTESETKGETKWQTKAERKAERKAAKKAAKDAKKAAKDAKRAAKRESMDPPKEHTKVKTRHVPT